MSAKRHIEELIEVANRLDPDLSAKLSESLARFGWMLSTSRLSPARQVKVLGQLASYLAKKADQLDPEIAAVQIAGLRRIRNELAHGRHSRERDFTQYYQPMWKAISKLAQQIGPFEIEDLLAYSMRIRSIGVAKQGASPAKVVAVYRPLFNAMDHESKRQVFRELLLRLFSDSKSMLLLDEEH